MMVKACVEIWPAVMGLLDDRENTQQIHNEIQKKTLRVGGIFC